MKIRQTLAAFAVALSLAGAAHAQAVQGLDGRWEGPVVTPDGTQITGVFRVTTANGVTSAVFDSPEQGAKDIPATVAREGETVTFAIPMAMVTYTAKLSADGKTLTGDMAQGGGSVPVTMTQKPASAYVPPAGPLVQGLDGRWEGSIETALGNLPVVFRVSSSNGKTTTLLDSPTQGATDIPATAKREAQQVTIDAPGVRGVFSATLSEDGKTLAGFWDQLGQSMSLTMTKK